MRKGASTRTRRYAINFECDSLDGLQKEQCKWCLQVEASLYTHLTQTHLIPFAFHPCFHTIDAIPLTVKSSCSSHPNSYGRPLVDLKRPLFHVARVPRCLSPTAPRSELHLCLEGSMLYIGLLRFSLRTFFYPLVN